MAEGSYVPAFDSLWDSPKTARLAKELRLSTEVAGAKFLKLMAWARDRVETGDLGTVEDRGLLAVAMGLARRRGDEVYRALVASRFISADPAGTVSGWSAGPGRIIDRRRAEREKKQRLRGGEARAAHGARDERGRFIEGSPASSLGTNGNVPRDASSLSPGTSLGMSPGLLNVPTRPIPPNPHGAMDHEAAAKDTIAAKTEPWRSVLERVYRETQSPGLINFSLRESWLEERDGGKYAVLVPHELARDYVSSRYAATLRNALAETTGRSDVEISIEVAPSA